MLFGTHALPLLRKDVSQPVCSHLRIFDIYQDGRMPEGYDASLLPTKGDKIVAHKAGRKGQAKANAAPLTLPLAVVRTTAHFD